MFTQILSPLRRHSYKFISVCICENERQHFFTTEKKCDSIADNSDNGIAENLLKNSVTDLVKIMFSCIQCPKFVSRGIFINCSNFEHVFSVSISCFVLNLINSKITKSTTENSQLCLHFLHSDQNVPIISCN